MDIQSPFIVIGTGRSGSQMLSRMLSRHPRLQMCPEGMCVVPRLWLELVENGTTINQGMESYTEELRRYTRRNKGRRLRLRDLPAPASGIEAISERARRTIRAAMVSYFDLDVASDRIWGMRELWNGTDHYYYDWRPYDEVFPTASWILLVRNPFTFVRSNAGHTGMNLNENYLMTRLSGWREVLRHSRRRALTGRYMEVRYEDLCKEPAPSVEQICNFLRVPNEPSCAEEVKRRENSSPRPVHTGRVLNKQEIERVIGKIPGFQQSIEELGYAIPEGLELYGKEELPEGSVSDERAEQAIAARVFQLDPNLLPEAGLDQVHDSQYWLEVELKALRKQLLQVHKTYTQKPRGFLRQLVHRQRKGEFNVHFLLAGSKDAGTLALKKQLEAHPEICMAPAEATHFFDVSKHPRGSCGEELVKNYKQHFPNFQGEFIVGERTPCYMESEETLRRIFNFNPKMQLVLLLRNPVERKLAGYRELRDGAGKFELSFQQWLEQTGNGQELYSVQIAKILKIFPREQLLVLREGRFLQQPSKVLKQVYDFLEVKDRNWSLLEEELPIERMVLPEELEACKPLMESWRDEFLRLERLLSWNLDCWRLLEP